MKRYYCEWLHENTVYQFFCEAMNFSNVHKIIYNKALLRGFDPKDILILKIVMVDDNNKPIKNSQLRLFQLPKKNFKRAWAK